MKAARAARKGTGGPSESKSDLSGLEIRPPKRTRGTSTKAAKNESQSLVVPIQENISQGDPNKFKILANEDIHQAGMEISSFMRGPGDSSSEEFKFWSNDFDGF